jgi:CDP-diacylglycerol---glycerol-3-phosphate 3-phosphatidyltransferase
VRVADAFSLARMLLTLPVAAAIVADRLGVAAGLALAALLTDFFDGYFARRTRTSTTLGRILDPVADKVLAAGTLGALLVTRRVPGDLVAVVVARDVILLSLGWVRMRLGAPVASANIFGKVAFTTLGVYVAGILLGVEWPGWAPAFVGLVYLAAGVSYATRLPAPFGRAVEGPR